MLRDSHNGLSLHSPAFVQRFSPQEVASSRSSSEDASKASGSGLSRTVRYRSPTPLAPTPSYATAASQCSPTIGKKGAKKKKAKKLRREKSVTPESACGSSQDRARADPWPVDRSRSPPGTRPRSRATARESSPKRRTVGRRRCPAPSPESRTPSPIRVLQVVRDRPDRSPDRGHRGREVPPYMENKVPTKAGESS